MTKNNQQKRLFFFRKLKLIELFEEPCFASPVTKEKLNAEVLRELREKAGGREFVFKKAFQDHPKYPNCILSKTAGLGMAMRREKLSLVRVLNSLEPTPNNWGVVAGNIARINRKECSYNFICKWQFLNKDGTEALFQDQTEETQLAVAKLLGYNKNKKENK